MYILNRFGRRRPLCAYCVIAGTALIIAGVLPKSNKVQAIVTALAIGGRMFITGNFANIFTYTSELYPTMIRNVGLGTGIFWARIGGIVAPQILLLGIVTVEAVPFIVFGGMLLLSAALALLLQETLNEKLPETIEEERKVRTSNQQGEKTDHVDTAKSSNIELT